MNRVYRFMMCLGLLSCFVLPLAACNTIEGLGKDTQAVGGAISGTAQKY